MQKLENTPETTFWYLIYSSKKKLQTFSQKKIQSHLLFTQGSMGVVQQAKIASEEPHCDISSCPKSHIPKNNLEWQLLRMANYQIESN